jgi:hypothetical protein
MLSPHGENFELLKNVLKHQRIFISSFHETAEIIFKQANKVSNNEKGLLALVLGVIMIQKIVHMYLRVSV